MSPLDLAAPDLCPFSSGFWLSRGFHFRTHNLKTTILGGLDNLEGDSC